MSSEAIDETGASNRQPNLVRDVAAIGLAALTLMLTVSAVTRSGADPIGTPIWPINAVYSPDNTVYPANESITNACGYWGALIAAALIDAVGMSAAIVIGGMGGVAAALLIRGRMQAPVLRSLGGTIVIIATATESAMLPLNIEGMPVVGNGGYLGAMTSTWLLEHFAPAGAWILSLTVLAVGLLLTTDYALVYAGRALVRGGKRVSRAGILRAAGALPVARRRRRPFTDLEQPITVDGDEPSLPGVCGEPGGARSTGQASGLPAPGASDSRAEPTIKFRRPKKSGEPTGPQREPEPAPASQPAAVTGAVEEWDELDDNEYQDSPDEASESDDHGEPAQEEEALAEFETAVATRELEIADETVRLRADEPHEIPQPKVRVSKRKSKVEQTQELIEHVKETAPSGLEDYRLPSLDLLQQSDDICYEEQLHEVRRKAHILEETFRDFGFNIRVVEIETGPVIAQYEIELEAGLRLSRITGLSDDLAIALRVPSVRIVAPIPGKNTVGIEVPNETRQVVRLRDVIEESDTRSARMNVPVFLGKDVSGNPMVVDLAKMPHLLIAGRTGTGKSVCLNAIISSILMCCRPDEVRMLMIDPKMVELSGYGRLPHLMHPVITDMRKAEAILAWAVEKMEERYSLLAKVGVRHINSFNDLGRDEILRRLEIEEDDQVLDVPDRLPFIVIIADEMADLMMTAGKDVEQHIIRLAQKSRAVGIHLILATQKPTVDVITGLIKSNLPARLSFQVASKTDSRVVLDENGADKLLGNGDMLFLWPGTSTLIRGQGTYLSDDEIDAICEHCSRGEQNFVGELMNLKVNPDAGGEGTSLEKIQKRDELYDSAIEVVIREGRGSCSLLQRCLGIGYGRAAKLIDFMAEDGIVGEYNGSKARDVIMTMAQWQALQGLEVETDDAPAAAPPRPRKDQPSAYADDGADDDDDADDDEEDDRACSHLGSIRHRYDEPDRDKSGLSGQGSEEEYEDLEEDEVA
jgi:S-DNA-T family DNA segregation ATPase FtsK/SpoIIIE